MKRRGLGLLGLALLVAGLTSLPGCGGSSNNVIIIHHHTPTPTATPAPTPTASQTPTPTATPTAVPNACLPSSSDSVLVSGTNATAYIPIGNGWGGSATGIYVVPIETSAGIGTGGAASAITTPNVVNSCSSNSKTGETVCVSNDRDVYLITGTTLNHTLDSGTTLDEQFSGGTCANCGVVVDASVNKALLTIGLDAAGGPGAYQYLDLDDNTFEDPIPAGQETSENVSIDPTRHLVLSPNE